MNGQNKGIKQTLENYKAKTHGEEIKFMNWSDGIVSSCNHYHKVTITIITIISIVSLLSSAAAASCESF